MRVGVVFERPVAAVVVYDARMNITAAIVAVKVLPASEPYTTPSHCSGPHATIEAYIYPVTSPCQWG